MGESTFLWVASHALARPDALTPFNDPDAQATNWFRASREALFGERIKAFGAGSSLRRATYVALFKVAYFRISLVFRLTLMRFHRVRVSCSSDGRFKGRPPLSAASPGFRLGPSVYVEVLLF
jgi:hypothetical protein